MLDQVYQHPPDHLPALRWATGFLGRPPETGRPGALSTSRCTLARQRSTRTGGSPEPVRLLAGLVKAGRPQLILRTSAGPPPAMRRKLFVP